MIHDVEGVRIPSQLPCHRRSVWFLLLNLRRSRGSPRSKSDCVKCALRIRDIAATDRIAWSFGLQSGFEFCGVSEHLSAAAHEIPFCINRLFQRTSYLFNLPCSQSNKKFAWSNCISPAISRSWRVSFISSLLCSLASVVRCLAAVRRLLERRTIGAAWNR